LARSANRGSDLHFFSLASGLGPGFFVSASKGGTAEAEAHTVCNHLKGVVRHLKEAGNSVSQASLRFYSEYLHSEEHLTLRRKR